MIPPAEALFLCDLHLYRLRGLRIEHLALPLIEGLVNHGATASREGTGVSPDNHGEERHGVRQIRPTSIASRILSMSISGQVTKVYFQYSRTSCSAKALLRPDKEIPA